MTRDRQHREHRFTRLLSTSGDRALYGCAANPYCTDTEIRRPQEPSPFAVKREQQRQRRTT